MASQAELGILLTAKDMASGVFRAFSGAAVAGMIGALSDAARAGAAEEASMIRIRTAADNTTTGFDSMATRIAEAQATAHQFGFATIEINDALALMTEQTGSVSDATDRLKLAEELARGAHIDLYTASKLLGKVTDDNVKVLGRYGINVKAGATETELFGMIQAKFGGQAEAYGNSVEGSIAKTTVAIDDWRASIGNAMGPAQAFVALLPGLSAGFSGAAGALGLLTTAQRASILTTAATVAPFLLVIATIALVVEALIQVKETVTFVTDNWNVFVYALTNGKLNDIPVFGFFFGMAQGAIAFIGNLIDMWGRFTSMISGFSMPSFSLPSLSLPSFDAGGIVPGAIGSPQMILAHGGEEVRTRAQQAGSSGITVVFSGNVYGMQDFEQKVRSVVRDGKLGGGFRGVIR